LPGKNGGGAEVNLSFDKFETGSKMSETDLSDESFNDVFADMKSVNSKFDVKPTININK
jgi:hypothetical protein